MTKIAHTFPEIIEEAPKATAFANQSFPYTSISSDRRFEELVYSLVKEQLGEGEFEKYDNISLMSGVAERGRDCALFQNNFANGVIQCKKYDTNLSKDAFGKEITKFILHSLQDNTILNDPETFTYYIAVARGFTGECSDFIDSFNESILLDLKLSEWIEQNLNTFKGLKPLKSQDKNELLSQVKSTLSSLTVKKISYVDLDSYLSKPELSHLSKLFFEVRPVTDNTEIQKATEEIIEKISDFASDNTNIEQELDTGSISLKSERNEFAEIPDSHIERKETDDLLKWILSDPKVDKNQNPLNLCLLAGNAGMGKTVILKDLYDKLLNTEIAVLGLKADKLASTSIKELQDKIGLSLPIFDFIEKCKNQYKTTVIIIDQIDALSQSMSSDRSYLQVFRNLIDHYLHNKNIRIIISTRIFDLHYDPSLQVYKNIRTIIVDPLSEEEVLTQLSKLHIHKDTVTGKLLELLKIPNHLNVFSKIYKTNKALLGISTLQEMYHELWKQKILNLSSNDAANKSRTKELLYKIAEKMFKNQQITVSERPYEDYNNELNYLQSERLLKNEDHQLQFFHQSFYDFVFAKQFVEREQDLCNYIKDNEQTLLLRSAVKMILNYLREYDEKSYIKSIKEIFTDNDILYHIKHMTLSTILFYEKPMTKESEAVFDAISNSVHLYVLFFEKGRSDYWFKFAVDNSLFEILKAENETIVGLKNINKADYETAKTSALNYLRNSAHMNRAGSWELILKLPCQSDMIYILRPTKNWHNPITYKVFEACTDFKEIDSQGYFRTLNNIAQVNPEYVLDLVNENITVDHGKKNSNRKIYGENDYLKTLAALIPSRLAPLLLDDLKRQLDENEEGRPIMRSYRLMQVKIDEKAFSDSNDYRYVLLALCLQKIALIKDPVFLEFFEQHKYSNILPILRLIIFAFKGNENLHGQEIYELVSHILTLEELHYDSTIAIETRIIFERAFSSFSTVQQQYTIDQIKGLTRKNEISKITKTNGKQGISSWWGLSKYCWLKKLPNEMINSNEDLKKLNLELTRKFPTYIEREESCRVVSGIVQRPLPEDAYQIMTGKQWLKSFRKYNGSIGHFERHFLKGDIDEHANAFKNSVKDDPSSVMLSIIRQAIQDPKIDLKYPIYGLWGWSESGADSSAIIPIFTDIVGLDLDAQLRSICSYISENLITEKEEDSRVINYLISSALEFEQEKQDIDLEQEQIEHETSVGNLITKGLNTKSGAAAAKLVRITDPNFKDKIFQTIELLLKDGPPSCRAAILYEFAYLMNVDKEKAFEIFRDHVLNEKDIHVLASAIWSLQYMSNYNFKSLLPAFNNLVSTASLGQDDSRSLFTILHNHYLFNVEDSRELLYAFMDRNKHCCSFAIQIVLENYDVVDNSKEKNDQILDVLLDKVIAEDFDNHGINFNESLKVNLLDIQAFLKRYIQSPYFRINDSLIDYLTAHSHQDPEVAVDLFNLALNSNNDVQDGTDYMYVDKSGVKFIISAFNSLIGNDNKSKNTRWSLMLTFDKILMDHRFKEDTESILEELT